MSYDVCEKLHGGDPCSQAANAATNKSRDRRRILEYLGSVLDATCDEVEVALDMAHQTCSARFSELRREGALSPTEKRPTRTGCKAQAFKLALA